MKDHAAAIVLDEAFAKRAERWPESTPDTKEAYYIREIFDSTLKCCTGSTHLSCIFFLELFPSEAAAKTAVRWIPRGDWGCAADPSGRSVSIHNAAY